MPNGIVLSVKYFTLKYKLMKYKFSYTCKLRLQKAFSNYPNTISKSDTVCAHE